MWQVLFEPERGLLTVRLSGHVALQDVRDLAEAHARALEATGAAPFRVLVDARGLVPLEPEAVLWLGAMKRVAAEQPGFRGVAVLADSATVLMQQHRVRLSRASPGSDGGGLELVTLDEAEALRFVRASTADR
ncbi:MAG: hypothetical protein NZ898_00075 [Myxococcota bacterium]|nr:hypothetical protein [Myxococcota bacterium]MDW8361680.1 hypothetical protein [Myxococcales bacterium]